MLHEFVGPSRFQWTDRQLEVINGLLSILPHKYCASISVPGSEKQKVQRPDIQFMIETDPSESARSAEIPGLLRQYFNILEWKEDGGAILHMLLHDIAGNFSEDRLEDVEWLKLCFQVEDALMASGDIKSDFVFVVCA